MKLQPLLRTGEPRSSGTVAAMGIQGLEKYLLRCHRDACPTVSLPELAAKYRLVALN